METDKNKQYQLKAQQFYKLVEQYKQTKGARQETIDKFCYYSHTVKKLHEDDFNSQPRFVFQYAYDVVAHYCAIIEHTIYTTQDRKDDSQ